ncbi:interferon-induced protein with tetratricopeptide repeats 1B-like, partial [Engraulis encrasicolus]|uniref:interferon-induced protein with tetratricopeptide repeats 1B-like n=1 Tax=Engraulis encrasicolus TaxID=184585 RepID=UPI002FD547F5
SAQNSTLLERLKQLQCHFTWTLSDNVRRLRRQRDFLEQGSESDSLSWKGHLYNVLAYIQYKIDNSTESTENALACLRKAEVILKEQATDGRGPELMVNQADQAWVHYHLGEMADAQRCLEEAASLQQEFPAPPGFEMHPEVHGEKGWTLMKFGADFRKEALSEFEKAVKGDSNRKAWHKGLILAKDKMNRETGTGNWNKRTRPDPLFLQQVEKAKEVDPDDIRISIIYLITMVDAGKKPVGEAVREAQTLALRVQRPLGDLSSILYFLRLHDLESALHVAQKFEKKYPSDREAKKQLAICYKRTIFKPGQSNQDRVLMENAIKFYEDVIRLYPLYVRGRIDLAEIYAKSGNTGKADQMYLDLLKEEKDLEPAQLQLLYSSYAVHLFHNKDFAQSIYYHKKAVEIPRQSPDITRSIKTLRKIAENPRHRRCDEMQEFLLGLKHI